MISLFLIIIFWFILFIAFEHNSILEGISFITGIGFYYFLMTIVATIFIFNLIRIFVDKKKGITKELLKVILSLIIIVAMVINYDKVSKNIKDNGYLNTLNYKRVKEGLDTNFKDNYKLLGLNGKDVSVRDTKCEYVYDVSLDDNSNIVFQAYYCPFGFTSLDYSFDTNYIYYYLPYYYELYKRDNDVTFKINNSDDSYSNNNTTIIYNNSNKDQLIEFLNYFDNNTSYKKYSIMVRNEDNNRMDYIRSKDDFRKIF
ncbi:MAG: hypothetical protein VZS44_05520 [Bacilli bacterium]|nr:hypothetical protein [Bacilli bacterium]